MSRQDRNITMREKEYNMKHVMAIVNMFESNNKNLNKTENTLFLTIYGILCCLAGRGCRESYSEN